MKNLILGLGISGKAAADLLMAKGETCIGVDSHPDAVEMEKRFPAFLDTQSVDLSEIGRVVVSPGIAPTHPLYREALACGIELIGEAELAFRFLRGQKALAITGTNGKTTVTLLVEHLLNSSGIKARALGNMGSPLTAYCLAPNPDEVIVAELSSYQLETMETAVFDAGVILNITPDHLDRYLSLLDYAFAKCRLKYCMKEKAPLFVCESVVRDYAPLLPQEAIAYSSEGIESFWPLSYTKKGRHEKENALAAWLLVKELGVTKEAFCKALETFKKPPHRIEYVAEVDGISFYDDSKGTNIDAVIQAVGVMPGKVVLIAGGVDKGSSYVPWKLAFGEKVKKIFVLGDAADKIQSELAETFFVEKVATLSEAVAGAASAAEKGECVLLSPGCASQDMFRNYAHRGEEFKRNVYDLQERRKET
jgi:UDP-N-acetylmuramoylalanine--D-glutamate ligase